MNGLCINAKLDRPGFRLDIKAGFETGSVTAILGQSGSGKSSLLRVIAGLEALKQGAISVNGETWVNTAKKIVIPVQRRSVGFMFQDYALFDHMSVSANIAYGLKGSKEERRKVTRQWLERMQLETLGDRYPDMLSGEQRQRVALARALAIEPKLLLMDEPFSAVDAHLKRSLIDNVRDVISDHRRTVLMVTHDVEEARTVADNIGVMSEGGLVRLGPAAEVFEDPRAYEAALVTGWRNLLAVQWVSGSRLGGKWGSLYLDRAASLDAAWIGIRPERIRIESSIESGIVATIKDVRDFGPVREVECVLPDGSELIVHKAWDVPVPAPGTRVGLVLPCEHLRMLSEGRGLVPDNERVAMCNADISDKEARA